MQITIGVWIIPAMLTVFIWLWITKEAGGGYFGGAFEAMFALFLIAVMWAVYFAIRYFLAAWGV